MNKSKQEFGMIEAYHGVEGILKWSTELGRLGESAVL
jgi:hypothetical protein